MIDGLPIVLHKEPPRQKIQQEEPAPFSGKSQWQIANFGD